MTSRRVVLTGDDLEPGLLVALHSVPEREDAIEPEVRLHLELRRRMEMARSGVIGKGGVPHRVLSVNLPYVVCMVIMPDGSERGPTFFDLRRVRLMRLDQAYVDAILEAGRAGARDRAERSDDDESPDLEPVLGCFGDDEDDLDPSARRVRVRHARERAARRADERRRAIARHARAVERRRLRRRRPIRPRERGRGLLGRLTAPLRGVWRTCRWFGSGRGGWR